MKTVFFDIDYTLYDGYLGTDFNLFMVKRGYAGKAATEAEARLIKDYKSGAIDYREAARRALQLHADCLKGYSIAEVQAMQLAFAKASSGKLFPWVGAVVDHFKQEGAKIYLVSAAPVTAIEAIAARLDIDEYFGTELMIENGIYTGELKTVLNYEEKHLLIQSLVNKTSGDLHIGFGDSEGDVDMLSAMDRAFLHEPKSDELINIAKEKGWTVVTRDTIERIIRRL